MVPGRAVPSKQLSDPCWPQGGVQGGPKVNQEMQRSMDNRSMTTVVVTNPQGLHARPADLFVKCAMQYESKVEIIKDSERFDGKSILDILALAAVQGTELAIEAVGPDAEAALKALTSLFERGFAEEEDLSDREGSVE